jgi:uncharacterized paraquat-inducible protein A
VSEAIPTEQCCPEHPEETLSEDGYCMACLERDAVKFDKDLQRVEAIVVTAIIAFVALLIWAFGKVANVW